MIYRSSAGSGKTRTLAKEYLKLALRYRSNYFKHILAVTFANKATQEMKSRILAYLHDFSEGRATDLASELKSELGLDDADFVERCREVQVGILHQYNQFSISTIDAFFQRVIRSFTREAGLVGDYRLEIEKDAILNEVIDNLMDDLGSDQELTNWVIDFAIHNLENDRPWDVRNSLVYFSEEIFKEEFKLIEDEVIKATSNKLFFKEFQGKLRGIRKSFLVDVNTMALQALLVLREEGWQHSDLKYGQNAGVFTFLETYAHAKSIFKCYQPKPRLAEFLIASNWPSKSTKHKNMAQVADEKIIPILTNIFEYREKNISQALSAELALTNLHVFGLISDISRKLKEYKEENNIMLLADAPKFLNGLIRDSDTPFIYEKVGSFYKNFLIDEFQDTSILQWENFRPLLTNSLDQGYQSLVVGDVKQAIYRWRGGDLNLLQQQVEQQIGPSRVKVEELNSNYRSTQEIVEFNNAVFKAASQYVRDVTGQDIATDAYFDVAQHVKSEEGGYIHVEFTFESESNWKREVLGRIPSWLERLQNEGVPLKDIAILVRKNLEGQEIVNYLMEYCHQGQAKPGCRYDVVSNESLRLEGAASVNCVLSAMKYLHNPDDSVARGQLAYEYNKLKGNLSLTDAFKVSNQTIFESQLPDRFASTKMTLKKLPLFELSETLIEIFGLGDIVGEVSYLQAFQELVLNFYTRERNDLGAFLEWWSLNGTKKSVQVSGEVDAAQILTIHKSKGLQFKYVLIPFCSWKMDHESFLAPNLWIKRDVEPFIGAGYLPVRYSARLEETLLADVYHEEHVKSYLDNLNLLYVALTRAEQGMIIMAPATRKDSQPHVGSILYKGITSSLQLGDGWNNQLNTYERGKIGSSAVEKPSGAINSFELIKYKSYDWRRKLVIRQSAKNYFESDHGVLDRIDYGVHMHTILSRITYKSELDKVLQEMLVEGLVSEAEIAPLREQLDRLFSDEQIASWFTEDWQVHTEIPILLPGGGESRMDRLIVKHRTATVIDFKTGKPAKADQAQVREYVSVLRQMNFDPVRGFLLYLSTNEVIEIKEGKTKVRKAKDESQLGLDF